MSFPPIEGAERLTRCPYTPKDHDLAALLSRYPDSDNACEGVPNAPHAEAGE